jgi:DNA polymerase I-like protein with 3'-5' exonuclease and polymerase domains
VRFDDVGFFWQDLAPVKVGRERGPRPMPPIPDTGWQAPDGFPNLSAAKAICIDTETYDPELTLHGPGWARGPGKGHMVGFSIGVPDWRSWYFPIRHEVEADWNLDADNCLGWLGDQLADDRPKIGAKLLYDLGWLRHEGIEVGGMLYDIQNAEPLIYSEAPAVSLEDLSQKYLGIGKTSSLLYQWCADAYGGAVNDRQRRNIYRSPPRLVGPYAESDTELPPRSLELQWVELLRRGCLPVFELETRLIRVLHEMRWRGAPVDIAKAEELDAAFTIEMDALEAELHRMAGKKFNVRSGDETAKVFDALGLPYGKTAEGKASITAGTLEALDHPFARTLLDYRQRKKLQSTFIRGGILNSHVNGRVHCSFNQLKKDNKGARSGRLSCTEPNLQNIPVRTDIGKRMRELFISALGGPDFLSMDYSQIEYRLLAHHATGDGANEIRARYNADPKTDYHNLAGDLIVQVSGRALERGYVKNANFGTIYGSGATTLAATVGCSLDEAKQILRIYHEALPFARATMNAAEAEVIATGYVETILGRKSDFALWVPNNGGWHSNDKGLPLAEAREAYGWNLAPVKGYKALNRKLQGGAADIMKKAMVDCYESGIFAETGYPMLTVHDELDFDREERDPNAAYWDDLRHIMENCVQLRVPIRVSTASGKTWADCK